MQTYRVRAVICVMKSSISPRTKSESVIQRDEVLRGTERRADLGGLFWGEQYLFERLCKILNYDLPRFPSDKVKFLKHGAHPS
jgi:hypothetical protein